MAAAPTTCSTRPWVNRPLVRSAVADCGLWSAPPRGRGTCPGGCSNRAMRQPQIAIAAGSSEVAVLFGAERTGLTTTSSDAVQLLLTIRRPCVASLNLAMAVQVVAYEILLATRAAGEAQRGGIPLAERQPRLQRFYAHLRASARRDRFHDRTGRAPHGRLRRFFNRAVPDQNEINILRGILTSCRRKRPPRR